MTREELIERICPTDASCDCSAGESGTSCSKCDELLNKWLDEYEAQVRAEIIDEVITLARAEIDFESQAEQKRFVEFMEHLREQKNISERKPIEHELKILPQFYNAVASHRKTFEIRKDDRDYQVGDRILLREFDGENYTNHQTRRIITYILRDAKEYGLSDGYCILGIQPIGKEQKNEMWHLQGKWSM